MRINRSMQFLIVVASLAACSPPGRHGGNGVEVSAQWDSGPLDRDYARAHSDLVAQHEREVATPIAGESAHDRDVRQAAENKDLEDRYAKGKASHATALPRPE
jgi:hypothetical protein